MNDCNSWYIDYPNSVTTDGGDLTYSVLNCVGLRDFETPRSAINIAPGMELDFRVGFNLFNTASSRKPDVRVHNTSQIKL